MREFIFCTQIPIKYFLDRNKLKTIFFNLLFSEGIFMLKYRNKFILLSSSLCSLLFSPSTYAFSYQCNQFAKEKRSPVFRVEYNEIINKLLNSMEELQVFAKGANFIFDDGTFAYAEMINSLGYVEQKYYAYTFDLAEKIENSGNKIFLKTIQGQSPIETILKQVAKSNFINSKSYKLKVFKIDKKLDSLGKYREDILKIEQKLHSIRIQQLSKVDLNMIEKIKGVSESRDQVLIAEKKHIEYVILSKVDKTPESFQTGFPNANENNNYKILSLDDAMKVMHDYEVFKIILPKFHALNNEWLYNQKQTDFQISERLDTNGKSFSPKEYYVSNGIISKTNISTILVEGAIDEFDKTGSITFINNNSKKIANHILTFINPSYYFSFKEISSEISQEYNIFKEVINNIHSEKALKINNSDISYAEYYDSSDKLVKKYYAIDNTDFDRPSNKSNIDYIILEGKIKKLPALKKPLQDSVTNSLNSDAEQRILEKFLVDTNGRRFAQDGILKIYTTYGKCEPCRAFYTFFKKLRPNMKIEVISLAEKEKDNIYKALKD